MDMKELVGNVLRLNIKDSTGGWHMGVSIHWNGTLDWNTGLEYWNDL